MAVPGAVHDPTAVRSESVSIQTDDGVLAAHLAAPTGSGPHPGVIVIHEAFGLNDHIRDLANRLANAGLIALAPDLYSRVGAPDPTDLDAIRAVMYEISDDRTVRDLEATASRLRAEPDSNGNVGCIGFCSGGRQALLLACRSDHVDAAIDCWGGFIHRASTNEESTANRPIPPLDMVSDLRCPLLAVFGAEDSNPSPEVAAQLQQRLTEADKPGVVRVFGNAGHGFLADYRDSYREEAAFELWPIILDFFRRHLE